MKPPIIIGPGNTISLNKKFMKIIVQQGAPGKLKYYKTLSDEKQKQFVMDILKREYEKENND